LPEPGQGERLAGNCVLVATHEPSQRERAMEFLLGLIIVALDIYAIVKIVQSGASGLAKILWILLIVIAPVLGFLIWLLFGPKGPSTSTI
jgi:hypothetical protein